jgi:thioredoxin reductase
MPNDTLSPASASSAPAAIDASFPLADSYDVVVIGGGAAGLSGALTLARSRRSVLVIDAGEQRNLPAAGAHGFLTHEGIAPSEIVRIGREEVESYGGTVIRGRVVGAARITDTTAIAGDSVIPSPHNFTVTLDDGRTISARRLLLTTGLVDELPTITGLRARWGRDVLHCPYCHGWEVRDQAIGIIATGPFGVHQALMFRQLSETVTLVLHAAPELTDEQREQLAARNIAVVDEPVEEVLVVDDAVSGVRLATGQVLPLQALVVGPRFVARSELLVGLGLEPTPHPMGMGEYIASEAMGVTAVPGVWVAGNVTDLSAQVVSSMGAGVGAGASINADLIAEDTTRAVHLHREQAYTDQSV